MGKRRRKLRLRTRMRLRDFARWLHTVDAWRAVPASLVIKHLADLRTQVIALQLTPGWWAAPPGMKARQDRAGQRPA